MWYKVVTVRTRMYNYCKMVAPANRLLPLALCMALCVVFAPRFIAAQPVLKTGGVMPPEWIDADTQHRIKRLFNIPGNSSGFYFHNNPFVGNKMIFYNGSNRMSFNASVMKSQRNIKNRQLWCLDLITMQAEQLTYNEKAITGEIVSQKLKEAFFQMENSVFAVNVETKIERLVYVFPAHFKASITTINADGTLLAGVMESNTEEEIYRQYPLKKDFFHVIYEAKLPKTLFTVNIKTRKLTKLFTENAWINHVQFSPTNRSMIMFCHEGPWHKVDRIWTIDVNSKKVQCIHNRSMDMEIAGHEWFGASGRWIWYDLQMPRGQIFYVGGTDVYTREETKFRLQRNEWSVHFTTSWDEKYFAGDGGDRGSVAKAHHGKYIYIFTPEGGHLKADQLVNMTAHDYKLEPNVHFSPDDKWIIFRGNFEGNENMYAVEIAKL